MFGAGAFPRVEANAMRAPSGVHVGFVSAAGSDVSRSAESRSQSYIQMSSMRSKARRLPFGENARFNQASRVVRIGVVFPWRVIQVIGIPSRTTFGPSTYAKS